MHFTMSGFPANHNTLTTSEIVQLAVRTEDVGMDRFGVTDFPFHQDCISVMTACLLESSRLQVESLVTSPYHRSPDMTATAWATMNELAPGRAILGIGRGVARTQMQQWTSMLADKPVGAIAAMGDLIRICRLMWNGETPDPEEDLLPTSGLRLDVPVEGEIPILVAARGPRMLRLAAAEADIVHLALPFLGRNFTNASIDWVQKCAREAGREVDDVEIDLTVAWSVLRDGGLARELSKLLAVTTILLAAEVWEQSGKTFGLDADAWKEDFPISSETLEKVRTGWGRSTNQRLSSVPGDIAELVTDEVLDAVGIAGEPEKASEQLASFLPGVPGLTGLRYKLPPLTGPDSVEQFNEMIDHAGQASDNIRTQLSRVT